MIGYWCIELVGYIFGNHCKVNWGKIGVVKQHWKLSFDFESLFNYHTFTIQNIFLISKYITMFYLIYMSQPSKLHYKATRHAQRKVMWKRKTNERNVVNMGGETLQDR